MLSPGGHRQCFPRGKVPAVPVAPLGGCNGTFQAVKGNLWRVAWEIIVQRRKCVMRSLPCQADRNMPLILSWTLRQPPGISRTPTRKISPSRPSSPARSVLRVCSSSQRFSLPSGLHDRAFSRVSRSSVPSLAPPLLPPPPNAPPETRNGGAHALPDGGGGHCRVADCNFNGGGLGGSGHLCDVVMADAQAGDWRCVLVLGSA